MCGIINEKFHRFNTIYSENNPGGHATHSCKQNSLNPYSYTKAINEAVDSLNGNVTAPSL
jgi:hypothetical protein